MMNDWAILPLAFIYYNKFVSFPVSRIGRGLDEKKKLEDWTILPVCFYYNKLDIDFILLSAICYSHLVQYFRLVVVVAARYHRHNIRPYYL